MRSVVSKLKPKRGFSYAVYLVYNLLLPVLVYVLIRAEFTPVAIVLVLLSKWRMFAVRPRFWLANIRANAVDIVVGVSVVLLMAGTLNESTRLLYAVAWAIWLVLVKPRNDVLWVSLQALASLTVGLMAVFSNFDHAPLGVLVTAVGFICFFTAHHFFYSFDERHIRLLAYVWSYFGAALTWILGHWLIFYYNVVAQPALLLVSLGFGLGTLYYLDHFDRLSKLIRRQVVFILITIVVVLLAFSDWGDKIV